MPIIIAISILITLFILHSSIEIDIDYKRLNENDRLIIIFKYLKIKLFESDVSMIDISKGEKGYGLKLFANKFKKKSDHEGHDFIHFDTIVNIYKDINKYYRLYTKTFNDIRHSIIRTSIIEKLEMKVELGVFNHAITGVSSGIIYALLWNIFSFIANNVKTKKHEILVTPRFDINVFRFDFFCIYTIRIGNIIYVAIRLVLLLIIHKIVNSKKIKKANINLNIN